MNDDAEIAELIDDFFAAMDEQDLEHVAALNAHDPDVVHVGTGPGERWIGWASLEAATEEQFEDLESFRYSHRERTIKLVGSGNVACFSQVMDVHAQGTAGEQRLRDARLTGVAERRDGRWVLLQTHLSLPSS